MIGRFFFIRFWKISKSVCDRSVAKLSLLWVFKSYRVYLFNIFSDARTYDNHPISELGNPIINSIDSENFDVIMEFFRWLRKFFTDYIKDFTFFNSKQTKNIFEDKNFRFQFRKNAEILIDHLSSRISPSFSSTDNAECLTRRSTCKKIYFGIFGQITFFTDILCCKRRNILTYYTWTIRQIRF